MSTSAIRKMVRIPVDGVELEGAFEAPPNASGIVVFAHGSGSSRMSPRNRFVAIELRRFGLATLLVDLLTEVEDLEGGHRFDIALIAERLHAAVRWARSDPLPAGLPLGLFGASTGAAAALEVAAICGDTIAAVASRGGRPDLARPESLARVVAPTLLIVGGADVDVMELNEAALVQLRCPRQIRIVAGATHLFEEPGTLEAVAKLAADWFAHHLTRESQAA
jgi:putative phosphoribosyl transferase